ncbi:MAG: outer membrane protein TolC [Cyclobacteriaceae bacterium]|jgi:outer membrane protein TolC
MLFSCIKTKAQDKKLSLVDVIELAKNQSPDAKIASTIKEQEYWFNQRFKSNYNPSLDLQGEVPGYNRSFIVNQQDNGELEYQSREQITSNLGLSLNQRITATGGRISINSSMDQFKNLNTDFERFNNTLFNVRIFQPLFGFNDLKWDKKTEPLRYEGSKRAFVEKMESISADATDKYFVYLTAQVQLQIAQFNLANNDTIYNIEQGRYNIGTASRSDILQVELQLLTSQQRVTQASLDMKTSKQELASFIGISLETNSALELLPPQELPDFNISLEKAMIYARENRSDFINFERRKLIASREVVRAKSERFQTYLTGSFGLNRAAPTLGESYNDLNNQQRVNVSINVPIVDWGRSKSSLKIALAQQQLEQYLLEQELQNFEQQISTLVSTFEVLRLQVEITKKSDEVAQERYDVAQNQYLNGKTKITDLNIALKEKDLAKESYLNALRAFWVAYFDLRRLTLYDFLNNELLYQKEG